MSVAPISVCLITREDPHLDTCIASFREHVAEVCVLITSSNDKSSEDICKKHHATYQFFDACNEDDKIVDFSMARNKSFEMATQPFVMWIDSDDLMVGAEKLLAITEQMPKNPDGVGLLFPYEYSYNANGVVSCKHYRERLVSKKENFQFVGPVHEVLVPIPGKQCQLIQSDEITFKHQRQYTTKPVETGRNLRILKKQIAKHPDDARTMYYIGLEYSNNGEIANAVQSLSKYVDVSGWDDERAMACYKLVELCGTNYSEALRWALKSVQIKPEWFESYYAVARTFYFMQKWQSCIDFAQLALSKGKTETLLFVNEGDRHDIHIYLNVALNAVGNIPAAYQSCLQGLVGNPNDGNLLHNKRTYEAILHGKREAVALPITDRDHLDIIFVAGPGCEFWSPDTAAINGIGGSETMLIAQAKNLVALGHKVRVYAEADGYYDGVEYIRWTGYRDLSCDVLIVSRNAQFLDASHNVSAHVTLLWLHDVCAIGATSALLLRADKILCLSEWHRDNVIHVHNLHPSKVLVTRNGVDLTRFAKPILRNRYRCINSSSPDRSWAVLLECWKDIKAQVPEAELHLYYGFLNWKASASQDKLQMDLIHRLEKQIQETPGVVFHDRVSQTELAEAFLASQAWLYPTWFTETSCLSGMEAQAAGCHIITSPIAALKETCAGYDKTTFIEGEWTSPEYKEKFVRATVKALHAV